ncbi:hypothetical protein BC835DRAFT_1414477 [Cytidiella melzeri]|nr:hypothetical protein BC835DRAFT_1414477 [Cytidiella melzeri]
MSQDDSTQFVALLASKFQDMINANSCMVAATTLLFYDYLLTFPDELRCIWSRKFSGATVLFVLNRYVSLISQLLLTIQLFSWDNQSQDAADTFTVFAALRTYAIWEKDRTILWTLLCLGLAPVGLNIFYYTRVTILSTPPPFTGCGELVQFNDPSSALIDQNVTDVFSIADRVAAICLDTLVIVLTWMRTARIRQVFSQLQIKSSIGALLLRDGALYFVVLLLLNIVNLIAVAFQIFGAVPGITAVITSIFVSRFFINLRDVYMSATGSGDTSDANLSRMSSVRFGAALVGNLGAPLEGEGLRADLQDLRIVFDEEQFQVPLFAHDPLIAGFMDIAEIEEGGKEGVEQSVYDLESAYS